MSYFFGSSAPAEEIPLLPVSTKPICTNVFNSEKTNEAIAEFVDKIEQKVAELKGHIISDTSDWENFFNEKGVKGVRKFFEGKDLAVIKSETVMPFHIVDIFDFLDNTTNAPLMDSMVNHIKVLKRFSPHSWVSCTTLHGQWPVISPREFVEFNHWKLLEDGSVLYFRFSEKFDELKPENADAVRGNTPILGYLLRPTEDGSATDISMIFDSSPSGDLPSILINQAMLNQPASLSIVRDNMVKLRDAGKARDVTEPARYEDFVAVINKNAAL